MNINAIVGDYPDLFLGRLKGSILWLTAENPNADIPVKSLYACVLFWNRKKETSVSVARFGLN